MQTTLGASLMQPEHCHQRAWSRSSDDFPRPESHRVTRILLAESLLLVLWAQPRWSHPKSRLAGKVIGGIVNGVVGSSVTH